jgi:hypothetical protein
VMSAIGPKQTCRKTQSMSLLGVKGTLRFAAHMSAFDPKRTSVGLKPFHGTCQVWYERSALRSCGSTTFAAPTKLCC